MGIASRRRAREAGRAAIEVRKPAPTDAGAGEGISLKGAQGVRGRFSEKRDLKGKRRAYPAASPPLWRRDEGSGGSGGVVLDMTLVGDQTWDP